jgi:hypothetical protein
MPDACSLWVAVTGLRFFATCDLESAKEGASCHRSRVWDDAEFGMGIVVFFTDPDESNFCFGIRKDQSASVIRNQESGIRNQESGISKRCTNWE